MLMNRSSTFTNKPKKLTFHFLLTEEPKKPEEPPKAPEPPPAPPAPPPPPTMPTKPKPKEQPPSSATAYLVDSLFGDIKLKKSNK